MQSLEKYTVGDLVIASLMEAGVNTFFGLPGTTILGLIEAVHRNQARFITARHEQAAVTMADAYARVTGRPAVCLVHAGPGVANTLISLATAHKDCSPVILISGNEKSELLGRGAYHEMEVKDVFKPVCKWSVRLERPDQAAFIIRNALLQAVAGKPGPVHIDAPRDVTARPIAPQKVLGYLKQSEIVRVPALLPFPDPLLVKKAAALIAQASRPVFLVGGGAIWSGAWQEMQAVAELTKIPVMTSECGRGIVSEDHELCLGATGRFGNRTATRALANADVVVAVGCRLEDPVTGFWELISPAAKIIQVDIDPGELGKQYPVDLAIVADARAFLQALIQEFPPDNNDKLLSYTKGLKQERIAELKAYFGVEYAGEKLHPMLVVKELQEVLQPDAVVTIDTGLHVSFVKELSIRSPRSYLRAAGFGTMGFALPAALGAKVAAPERQVIALTGDGGYAMVMQELETAFREEIAVTCIIFNNYAYGSQVARQERLYGGKPVGVYLKNPDFAAVAREFGVKGAQVHSLAELRTAFRSLVDCGTTAVIDVVIDPAVLPPTWQAEAKVTY